MRSLTSTFDPPKIRACVYLYTRVVPAMADVPREASSNFAYRMLKNLRENHDKTFLVSRQLSNSSSSLIFVYTCRLLMVRQLLG